MSASVVHTGGSSMFFGFVPPVSVRPNNDDGMFSAAVIISLFSWVMNRIPLSYTLFLTVLSKEASDVTFIPMYLLTVCLLFNALS